MSLVNMHTKLLFLLGAISSFLAVGLGAIGSHLLKKIVTQDLLNLFEIGVRYQMFHSLGILLSCGFFLRWRKNYFLVSAYFFLCGIFLFSGSLYAIAFTGEKFLARVTPFGGFSFLIGWLTMFYSFVKMERNEF